MFERILLPLDGSEFAEVAIPYAEYLAGKLGSEVVVLHACQSGHEPFRHMHQIYIEQVVGGMKRQIRKGWRAPGEVSLKAEALVGEPADVIYDYVENNAIRLVVMSTCGGSGLKTWLLGSVAEKVVRSVSAPILLVRVKRGQPVSVGRRSISRILLPLDGSEVSKTSVPYALEIARKLKASITLYGMVDEAQVMSPLLYSESMVEKYTEMKAATEKEFRSYIGGVEKELRQEGVHVTHVVTRGYDAAHEILNQEKATKAELVVMATRGRSPVARWAFGSVAEKVLREGDLPLLLVREAAR